MKIRPLFAHFSALSLTSVTLALVACGGTPSNGAEGGQLGTATSALTADCGDGVRSVVGTDVLCTYPVVGTFAGANGFTAPANVTKARVLVVAGGGGGAHGGGGGGGVLHDAALVVVPGTPVTVTVGGGGKSNQTIAGLGANGGDSSFGAGMIALGGGGGGAYGSPMGKVGGSGGGNGCDAQGAPAAGTANQGNSGGKSNAAAYGGSGGGGGAGAKGDDGGPKVNFTGTNPTVGGNGGAGLEFDISGANTFYGGGGGGGVNTNSTPSLALGLGGAGGGGAGARAANMAAAADAVSAAGTANTGGGGGGGDCEGYGGPGGSGIVIVRYTPCTLDAQCSANQWCNSGASPAACVADLANGATIPNVPSHTTPPLTGTCTPQAGAAVCASAVCDGTACGYPDGVGPCTAQNGATVCRSGVCAADGKCGPTPPCTDDTSCSATQFCDKGATPAKCADKKADGSPCATPSECTTGACTNNVCGDGGSDAGSSGTSGASSGTTSGDTGGGGGCAMTNRGSLSSPSFIAGLGVLALALGARRRSKRA